MRLVARPVLDAPAGPGAFFVVDTVEDLEGLLPAELYAVALHITQHEPVLEVIV